MACEGGVGISWRVEDFFGRRCGDEKWRCRGHGGSPLGVESRPRVESRWGFIRSEGVESGLRFQEATAVTSVGVGVVVDPRFQETIADIRAVGLVETSWDSKHMIDGRKEEDRGPGVTPRDFLRASHQERKWGMTVAVHAIGDKANDMVLDLFSSVKSVNEDIDHRFRIEHAQHLVPKATSRFGAQGVIASVQILKYNAESLLDFSFGKSNLTWKSLDTS
ncbi:hypothetical protein KSP40_PGU020027 [Platanthera guangdongensis]|uniref:Amidohydrolase 3 domain-containing protein n=1 Tax=Platanthera guangdongensis TaxID=2320717 RepID=A0ABR2MCJ8_9ASPA